MTFIVARVERPEVEHMLLHDARLSAVQMAAFSAFIDHTKDMWKISVDDTWLALLGAAPATLLSDSAYLWLYHTPAVQDHEFIVVRRSQIIIRDLLKAYSKLRGHCIVGQENSIRWMRWLGAEFGKAEGHLIPFTIKAKKPCPIQAQSQQSV